MNIKQIKALSKIMQEFDLTVIDYQENDTKIRLEKKPEPVAASSIAHVAQAPVPIAEKEENVIDFNKITEIKSPMVGIFYAAAAPDAPPFVKVGSRVKKGDVLCIIEAMKIMNEITSEVDGEIVDICVEDQQLVEFSQPLFRIF